MQKRNHYVDALKGYVILLVVAQHAIQRTEGFGFWPSRPMSPYLLFSAYMTMPLFFAISGYLTFGRVRRPLKNWLGAKARLLMIPFVSWTLLYYFAVRDKFIPTNLSILGYAHSQVVGPSLWYLVVLSLCYLVLAIGFRFGDWTLPLLGVVLALIPAPWLGSLQWFWWWFIGGYFIARFRVQVLSARKVAWAAAVPAYIVGFALVGQNIQLIPRAALSLAAAIVGTLLVQLLQKMPLPMRLIRHLGVHSLEIYVGQFLFVQLLIVRNPFNALVTGVLAVAGSLALGSLLRKNPWTDAIFLGAKKLPQ